MLTKYPRIIYVILILSLSACSGDTGSSLKEPTAEAGADQQVNELTVVTLTGNGAGADGGIVNFSWVQTGGITVAIEDAENATATFRAPELSTTQELTFQLTVTDNNGASSSDDVSITVIPITANIVLNETPSFQEFSDETLSIDIVFSSSAEISNVAWSQNIGNTIQVVSVVYDENSLELNVKTPFVSEDQNTSSLLTLETTAGTFSENIQIKIINTLPEEIETLSNMMSSEHLVDFEDYLNELVESENFTDHVIFPNREIAPYRININFSSLNSHEIENLPDDGWRVGDTLLYDHHIIKNQAGEHYLVISKNFDKKEVLMNGATLERYPDILFKSNGVEASFIYSFPHNNAHLVKSLLRVHHYTSDATYLDLASAVGDSLIKIVGDDNVYKRRYLNEKDWVYTGMDNGIILDSLYWLARYSQNGDLYDFVRAMAESFHHSTEGVWNHWSNSAMAKSLTLSILGKSDVAFDEHFHSKLELLISEVARLNGLIPYVMKVDYPGYPVHKATYQTYDTMLLAKMQSYFDRPLNIESIYYLAQEKSSLNYRVYRANNAEALMYAYFNLAHYDLNRFESVFDPGYYDTGETRDLVSNLRIISSRIVLEGENAY